MTESFENVLVRLKSIVPHDDNSKGLTPMVSVPWVEDIALRLEAAHDAEMKQLSKAEYHRGYEDGKAARKADEWQLDRERAEVVRKLDALILNADVWNYYNLSAVCKAVYEPSFGWTIGACEALRDELVRLMGVVRETVETTTYDELGNERHKAVCELRKIRTDTGGFVKSLANAVGVEWQAPRAAQTLADVRDRLIHLLGGDQPTLSDLYGIWKDSSDFANPDAEPDAQFDKNGKNCEMGQDNGTCPKAKARHLTDECNFSAPESYMDAEDGDSRPTETSEDAGDHVAQGTGPQNLSREEKKASPNIWYDVMEHDFWITTNDKAPTDHSVNLQDAVDSIFRKTGSVEDPKTPESVENLQEVAEMGEGEAPVASITDELRRYVTETWDGSVYVNHLMRLLAIADRIDEQFDRCCKLWERTATDTAQEIHDSMEAERNKLVDERDMWHEYAKAQHAERDQYERELEEWLYMRDELDKWKRAAERDADVMENLSGQLADMTRKRDKLRKKYQRLKHRVLRGMAQTEPDTALAIMQDFVAGRASQDEAVARIEALRDA